MSAICGIYHLDNHPASSEELASAMDASIEYGHDGSGIGCFGPVVLGHQMTHITLESQTETLPLYLSEQELAITADARLDNRDELFARLVIPQPDRASMSDSELILRAYQKWGVDTAKYLLGDFAFAIWDGKQQRLCCSRDIVGAKPFYYFAGFGEFYFATDIRSVLSQPLVPHRLNLSVIKTRLQSFNYGHPSLTYYEEVLKLPPAHSLIVTCNSISLTPYWQPEDVPEVRLKDDQAYIDMLLELVQQAVKCRLRAAYPIGAHISGGLDSSTVAVLAACALRQSDASLVGYSWSQPPTLEELPLQDERAYIEALCHQEQIELEYTQLTPLDIIAEKIVDVSTQPSHMLMYERTVSRKANSRGIRVLLSGWGGDELPGFNGRGYFASLFLKGRLGTLLRELRLRHSEVLESSILAGIAAQVIAPLLPLDVIYRLPSKIQKGLNLPRRPRPFTPVHLLPAFVEALNRVQPIPRGHSREIPGVHANQIGLYRNGHLTNRMQSWAAYGAKHQIEYRYPLLDRRIVEFSLGVPEHLFFKNGWKRYMFRQMTENILPSELQWSKFKRDPALPNNALTSIPEGPSLLAEILESRRTDIQKAGLVDVDSLLSVLLETGIQRTENFGREIWLAFISSRATY